MAMRLWMRTMLPWESCTWSTTAHAAVAGRARGGRMAAVAGRSRGGHIAVVAGLTHAIHACHSRVPFTRVIHACQSRMRLAAIERPCGAPALARRIGGQCP